MYTTNYVIKSPMALRQCVCMCHCGGILRHGIFWSNIFLNFFLLNKDYLLRMQHNITNTVIYSGGQIIGNMRTLG